MAKQDRFVGSCVLAAGHSQWQGWAGAGEWESKTSAGCDGGRRSLGRQHSLTLLFEASRLCLQSRPRLHLSLLLLKIVDGQGRAQGSLGHQIETRTSSQPIAWAQCSAYTPVARGEKHQVEAAQGGIGGRGSGKVGPRVREEVDNHGGAEECCGPPKCRTSRHGLKASSAWTMNCANSDPYKMAQHTAFGTATKRCSQPGHTRSWPTNCRSGLDLFNVIPWLLVPLCRQQVLVLPLAKPRMHWERDVVHMNHHPRLEPCAATAQSTHGAPSRMQDSRACGKLDTWDDLREEDDHILQTKKPKRRQRAHWKGRGGRVATGMTRDAP